MALTTIRIKAVGGQTDEDVYVVKELLDMPFVELKRRRTELVQTLPQTEGQDVKRFVELKRIDAAMNLRCCFCGNRLDMDIRRVGAHTCAHCQTTLQYRFEYCIRCGQILDESCREKRMVVCEDCWVK